MGQLYVKMWRIRLFFSASRHNNLWLCSHGLESRSERRFRTWFGPFLIWKPDFSPCELKLFQIRLLKHVLKRKKRVFWIVIRLEKPDSRTCECKTLSERNSCICILKMRAEAMHKRMGQSACADCVVGAKYYLAVRRSWSWLGRRLQSMWTHVVQITIPITFWIAIRNIFRNVILAHVNTAYVIRDPSSWVLLQTNGRMCFWCEWFPALNHINYSGQLPW